MHCHRMSKKVLSTRTRSKQRMDTDQLRVPAHLTTLVGLRLETAQYHKVRVVRDSSVSITEDQVVATKETEILGQTIVCGNPTKVSFRADFVIDDLQRLFDVTIAGTINPHFCTR
jgi:hypothetical protein